MYIVMVKIFGEYNNVLAWNEANDGYYYAPKSNHNGCVVKFVTAKQARKFMKRFYNKYPKCEYKIIKQ